MHSHNCRYSQDPSTLSNDDNTSFLTGHEGKITCLYYSSKIFSGSEDGTIRIWTQGAVPLILPHVSVNSDLSPVLAFAISVDDRIASIAEDGIIRLWENALLAKTWNLPEVFSVNWSPNGKILMGVSRDAIYIWTEEMVKIEGICEIKNSQWRDNSHFSVISNNAVWIWGIDTAPVKILTDSSSSARWNHKSTVLGIVSNNRLGLYKDDSEIWWISVRIIEFDFAPSGNILVTGGFAGEVHFWDVERRVILRSFQGHEGKVLKILHRSDGEFLATAGSDGILHIWKTEECQKIKSISVEEITDM